VLRNPTEQPEREDAGISKIEIKKEGGLSPWETAFLLLRGEY